MAKIERFEDLKCWQEARALTRAVYRLARHGAMSRDFRLRDQLTAAAVSILTNIAERVARYHKADFIRFPDDAQSSAAEVKCLLYVVLGQQYAEAETVTALQKQPETCQRMILGLLKHVRRTMERDGTIREAAVAYTGPQVRWDVLASYLAQSFSPPAS
jgi:four helix bundle protein